MDFEESGQKFWQWLEANGAMLSEAIAFKDYRASEDAGRGVVATRDIKVQAPPPSFRNVDGKLLSLTHTCCTCRKEKFYFQYLARCCYQVSRQRYARRREWQIFLTA